MPRSHSRPLRFRADQTGALFAGANAPLTLQRTLMPRNTLDQAIVSGLSISANHAFVTFVQESVQAAALVMLGGANRKQIDDRTWSRAVIGLDLAAIGAGVLIQRAFEQRPREPLPRAAGRTTGYWLTLTGTAGALIGGLQEALGTLGPNRRTSIPVVVPAVGVLAALGEWGRRRRAHLDTDLPPEDVQTSVVKSLAMGAGVVAGLSGLGAVERTLAEVVSSTAAAVLPGNAAVWRPLGHVAALAVFGFAGRYAAHLAYHHIESQEAAVEAAFDIPPPNPRLSGSLDSRVEFATLSRAGRRFAWMVTAEQHIATVMGEPAVAAPIRTYVGLASAPTEEARVALVMSELERTGAFERSWLMVASPTGTGYVNYAAVGALELLTRGDCATAAMQYAARPSVLSLDRVSEGRHQARLLLDALRDRLATLPVDRRPKLVLFGESLGAWTSQDPFVDHGTQGLVDAGIDHAIWIGTPHFSKWKEQVLHDDRADVDPSVVGVFASIDEWRALSPQERDGIRYVMITHHDDGVALFGPELAIQAPEWLGPPAQRPPEVPKGMRWVPSTTFFQVLMDLKNSANVKPGVFEAKGHEYRADLLPFFHAVLGIPATPEQLDAITEWLQERELERSEWMHAHARAGQGLAATLVERWMAEARAAGADAERRLAEAIRRVAAEEFGAGGGGAHDGLAAADADAPG